MSGFADSHLHLLALAQALLEPTGERDGDGQEIADVLDGLAEAVAGPARPSGWVVARGFDDALVRERRLVRRRELDAIARTPLRLRHRTGHASLLNTAAFDALPELPRDARVEPDDEGQPVMLVGAEAWLGTVVGHPERAATLEGLRRAQRLLLDRGIDRVWDATPRTLDGVEALRQLLVEAEFALEARTMLGRTSLAADDLTGATVKLFPGDSAAGLEADVVAAHARGASVAVHATTEVEVEAVSLALSRQARDGLVDRVEHATLLSARQAERIARAGAVIVTHPGWLESRRAKYAEQLTPRQQGLLMPFRVAVAEGCRLAFASDAPVELPDPQRWLRCACVPGEDRAIDRDVAWRSACGTALWGPAEPEGPLAVTPIANRKTP